MRSKSIRFGNFITVTALACLIMFTTVLTASAQKTRLQSDAFSGVCGLYTLKGNYGYIITGNENRQDFGGWIPMSAVGRTYFDGVGGGTIHDTTSFAGIIFVGEYSLDYTVNPDCTGTLDIIFVPEVFIVHTNMVITDNGKEILFIETDAATVNTGRMYRQ